MAANIYGSKRDLADIDIDVSNITRIKDIIKDYITFDGKYKDDDWDCEMVTLNHNGQEIDLVLNAKIFDKNNLEWVNYDIDFNTCENVKYLGIELYTINKKDLLSYKSKLLREVDIIDIKQCGVESKILIPSEEEILKMDFYDYCGSSSVFMTNEDKINYIKNLYK